ncbi:hypothetical protein [Streptacidiphilus rugosus]|uniref:hypothetical protein n=1 Tax=Streptacidiphilus rugosus TaxID=405783 RepID=UPI0006902786|nr:hypothetical protein [Streptacidiphilus rugosus]
MSPEREFGSERQEGDWERWESRLPRFLRPPAFLASALEGREHSERVVRPRLALIYFCSALVLVPWTVFLFLTLPGRERAAHWDVAWGGFDAILIVVFTGCAVRILRLSPRSALVTAVAGALLVTDAWFDVMLSSTGGELAAALLMALLVELPLAALCFRTSLRVLSLLEQARPYLRDLGFTVQNGRLLPPPDWPERP